MAVNILRNISGKILVIGPLFGKLEKINKIKELAHNYQYIILNGNAISSPNIDDYNCILQEIKQINNLLFNVGNIELTLINDNDIKDYTNIILIQFENKYNILITNGGIHNNMNMSNILDTLESTFISHNWHETYNGKIGYVISNNPILAKEPDFFKFSARIGNVMESNIVYAQEIDKFGLKRTIVL